MDFELYRQNKFLKKTNEELRKENSELKEETVNANMLITLLYFYLKEKNKLQEFEDFLKSTPNFSEEQIIEKFADNDLIDIYIKNVIEN